MPVGNPKETALTIEKALRSSKGEKARKRIIEKFPFRNRKQVLLELIEKMK